MKIQLIAIVSLISIFVGSGCNKSPEPVSRKSPAQAGASALGTNEKVVKPHATVERKQSPKAGKLAIGWTDPAGWKRVKPKNSMRKASYEIEAAASDAEGAELNVFYFGPRRANGPDPIEANIQRWVGQFKGVKTEDVIRSKRKANELQQHVVEIKSGLFSAGGMMMAAGKATEKPQFGLLGAIVETPSGDYFFKLTGPTKTVLAAKPSLMKLLDSVKLSQ